MTDRAAFEAAISSAPYERDIARWPGDQSRYAWAGVYKYESVSIAWEMWQEAARQEREACAAIVDKWSDASHLTLHAGEMTAQELRTVLAVVAGIKADIGGKT